MGQVWYFIVSIPDICLLSYFGAVVLSCLLLQPCGHLLGKGYPLGSLVCDVFLCFCHFSMSCPGSGVVLYCIDS